MAEKILSIYLASAIRDNNSEDIQWREDVIDALEGLPVRILNPLGGKIYQDGKWAVSGVPSTAKFITKHDLWMVRNEADIILFNFRALSQGYANIGTLVEYGIAVGTDKLIYVIVDPEYKGHENTKMYNLHPFINEFAAQVFDTTEQAIDFLKRHLTVISGRAPSYPAFRAALKATQERGWTAEPEQGSFTFAGTPEPLSHD